MPGPGSLPVRERSGQRRHKMSLQASGSTLDTMGGLTSGSFTEFGQDEADITEVPFVVNATEHGLLYKVTIKYRSDVVTKFYTEKKRLQVVTPAGRSLSVLELENPEARNIELVLHCA